MSKDFSGVSPVGRMISGAIFEKTTKGHKGKEVAPHHYLQLAIPKTDPGLPALFDNMKGAAAAGFFNNEPARPTFAWKFHDGDKPENSQKEGWAGCFVFTFKTGFDISSIVDINNQQIIDPNKIKRGYQIRVAYYAEGNKQDDTAGIYLNFNMVQLVSIDKEIQTGPAASEVFAAPAQAIPMQPGAVPAVPGAPMQVPPGPVQPQAQPTPMPPQAQPGPVNPMPPQAQPGPVNPMQQQPPMQQQNGPIQPDHTFLHPQQ